MIDERVVINTNSQGHPIIVRTGNQRVEVCLSENASEKVMDVEIIGDEASLRLLGEIFIGISKAPGYHMHLESNSETSPVKISANNIRLTICNKEKGATSKPSSPPPTWARG